MRDLGRLRSRDHRVQPPSTVEFRPCIENTSLCVLCEWSVGRARFREKLHYTGPNEKVALTTSRHVLQ